MNAFEILANMRKEKADHWKYVAKSFEEECGKLRAELEAATERAEVAEGHVKKLLETGDPKGVLRKQTFEAISELEELRRQIDGANEITAEYFGDFVCWTPTFDEPTELKLNMQPGETRTFKLLEVKP